MQLHFETVDWRHALDAWRDEHWVQQNEEVGSHHGMAVKRAARDAFYVAERAWQQRVVRRGEAIIGQTLAGLAL